MLLHCLLHSDHFSDIKIYDNQNYLEYENDVIFLQNYVKLKQAICNIFVRNCFRFRQIFCSLQEE